MSKRSPILVFAVFAPLLVACGPAPEQVCEHVLMLTEAELGSVPGERDKYLAGCVHDAELDREADRKSWKRRAECVLAVDSLAGLSGCEKPPSEDE